MRTEPKDMAFPYANNEDNNYHWIAQGLSKREWFAGMAMQANAHNVTATPDEFADDCYMLADAMLAASERKEGA